MRDGWADEKVRKTCWQGWRELAADEANRKRKLGDDVNGATNRCADILTLCEAIEMML